MESSPGKLLEEQRLAEAEWEAMKSGLDAIPREDVTVPSQNRLGECPVYIHGDFSKTTKGLKSQQLSFYILLYSFDLFFPIQYLYSIYMHVDSLSTICVADHFPFYTKTPMRSHQ